MRCIVSAHMSHLYIVIVFGGTNQIRFHLQAIARRRKTITYIYTTIIIYFLCRMIHLFGQHSDEWNFLLVTGCHGFQFQQLLFHFSKVAEQTFLRNIIHLRQGIVQCFFFRHSFLYRSCKGGQHT